MKTKKSILCVMLTSLIVSSCAPVEKHNVLTEAEKAEGWQLLFNGADLTG